MNEKWSQCECCTAEGVATDPHGVWMCDECLYVSAAADEYGDDYFEGDAEFDYADPD